MIQMAQIMRHWATSNQPRRCPKALVKTGTGNSSIKGAHTNLKEYPNAAQLKKVTALLSMPASPNHRDKLEKISRIGIPAENPKNSMIKARRSKKARKACVQSWLCEVIVLRVSIRFKAAI